MLADVAEINSPPHGAISAILIQVMRPDRWAAICHDMINFQGYRGYLGYRAIFSRIFR